MTRRDRDILDIEISERQRARANVFDSFDGRPDYQKLSIPSVLSGPALRECGKQLGPAFIYELYVPPVKLLEAFNLCKALMCLAKNNPLSPYINIVSTSHFDEGEWCLEANGKRVGSHFPW